MKGAIIGDIIGSRFEARNLKSKDFKLFTEESRFTDDTVLTVAVAHSILQAEPYEESVRAFARAYPNAGYGGTFRHWMQGRITGPYNSWGNGSAMRVSPVGYAFSTRKEVLAEARKSAEITHNHPEGIRGAQAIALGVFLARNGISKKEIKRQIENETGYDLNRRIEDIRPHYRFDVSCRGSVPEAIIAFLESEGFEDAIRTAVSIGGDSDTIACMAGALAGAFYQEIPEPLAREATRRLPKEFRRIIIQFENRYPSSS